MSAGRRSAVQWSGRDDGSGDAYARWHSTVRLGWPPEPAVAPDAAVIGFCSDEGVRRNHGRVGAAAGPASIREMLAQLAAPRRGDGTPAELVDLGDIVVEGEDLESAQALLGATVREVVDAGALAVVLGGGHDVAFGSYLGLAACERSRTGERQGVFNLDAHLDLRRAEIPTSGTPFLQMFLHHRGRGAFRYAAAGISIANNTRELFDTAESLGVSILFDDECTPPLASAFVREFLAEVDLVHLTIDLDGFPAAVAPGVSAPAGFGIDVSVARDMCRAVAASGKLAVLDVAELNPRFDVDGRTARLAARMVDDILRACLR
ncbi:formimidoylglutamase [Propionicicella superfundia]|uniref:formimidoylglutamase n=1 Tax=Propionicicella superfundia TaxID=348582 RepID=UPI00048C9BE6|nr:formimidoylglutamase [Propionicicella superfundia]